jgi:hypothetical protein
MWGDQDALLPWLGEAAEVGGQATCAFDVVVACDVLYNYCFEPLLDTLRCLLSRTGPLGEKVVLLISYEQRGKDLSPFFAALRRMGCSVEEVPRGEMHPNFTSDLLHILRVQATC